MSNQLSVRSFPYIIQINTYNRIILFDRDRIMFSNRQIKNDIYGIVDGYSGPSSLLPSQKQSNGDIIEHGTKLSTMFAIIGSSNSVIAGLLQISRRLHVVLNISILTDAARCSTSRCVSSACEFSTDAFGSVGVCMSN